MRRTGGETDVTSRAGAGSHNLDSSQENETERSVFIDRKGSSWNAHVRFATSCHCSAPPRHHQSLRHRPPWRTALPGLHICQRVAEHTMPDARQCAAQRFAAGDVRGSIPLMVGRLLGRPRSLRRTPLIPTLHAAATAVRLLRSREREASPLVTFRPKTRGGRSHQENSDSASRWPVADTLHACVSRCGWFIWCTGSGCQNVRTDRPTIGVRLHLVASISSPQGAAHTHSVAQGMAGHVRAGPPRSRSPQPTRNRQQGP